jgi:hypothetical protein
MGTHELPKPEAFETIRHHSKLLSLPRQDGLLGYPQLQAQFQEDSDMRNLKRVSLTDLTVYVSMHAARLLTGCMHLYAMGSLAVYRQQVHSNVALPDMLWSHKSRLHHCQ